MAVGKAIDTSRLAGRERRQAVLIMGAATVAIVLLMSVLLRQTLHRRLQHLITTMARAEAGDLTAEASIHTEDELGRLAESFNRMLRRIRNFNAELQDKVAQATADLRDLNGKLFETRREMGRLERLAGVGEVAAMVAHEVGTPLTSISGHLQLLAEEVQEARVKERLSVIEMHIKPFNLTEVRLTSRRACERRLLLQDNRRFQQALQEKYRVETIVGTSPKMVAVYRTVARVASTRSTIVLVGESGTGKELMARAIHYHSPRRKAPFVAVDCGALPESLLESELFGHEKGAFTGAQALKKGLFEVAQAGTIFLDEIGDIGPSLQAKLLRVLQEHEVRRVGGIGPLQVDIRVIAATRQALAALVTSGKFREDLFSRLRVVTITLPRLRARRDDIPLLARHFLGKYASEADKRLSHIASEAMAHLCRYDWPGNVRELEHVIERAVALTANPILLVDDLPTKLQEPTPTSAMFPSLEEMEKRHLQLALEKTAGNRRQAALLLGVSRRTLYRMAKRHGLLLDNGQQYVELP